MWPFRRKTFATELARNHVDLIFRLEQLLKRYETMNKTDFATFVAELKATEQRLEAALAAAEQRISSLVAAHREAQANIPHPTSLQQLQELKGRLDTHIEKASAMAAGGVSPAAPVANAPAAPPPVVA